MRPKVLHIGGTLYWVIRTRNPDTQVLKDADSTPTVAVRKNGASVGDSVTITKRSATTGIYDCSYNPAGEIEGDEFTIEETATVTGTTTAQATYTNSWEFTVIAVERGTDGANTTTPPTASANATAVRSELGLTGSLDSAFGDIPTVSEFNARTIVAADYATAAQATAIETDTQDIQTRLPAALVSGRMDASVGAMASNTLTAAALATDAVTEIQVGLATSSGVTAAFTEIKGATWSSSTDTLEAIRDASGGGGTSIMVTPVVAQVPVRVRDTDIETYIGDLSTIRIGIFSGEDAVDLSGFGDLEVCVQAKDGTDLDFIEMADLTIDGTDNNYVSWEPSGPSVATVRRGKWSLRKTSNKQVIAKGAWIISDAALEDAGS